MHGAQMQGGATPLTLASRYGHFKTIEVLLEHKADVNVKDNVSRRRGVRKLGGYGLGVGVWDQGSVMA